MPTGGSEAPAAWQAVTLEDGHVVTPEQVLGGRARAEDRPDRRHGSRAVVVDAAHGADLLVHEATFCEEEASGHARPSTRPRSRRRVARDADVSLLALTHLSTRYFGSDVERGPRDLPGTVGPRDFDAIEVPFGSSRVRSS